MSYHDLGHVGGEDLEYRIVDGAAGLQQPERRRQTVQGLTRETALSDALLARCLRRSRGVLGQRRCKRELTRGLS